MKYSQTLPRMDLDQNTLRHWTWQVGIGMFQFTPTIYIFTCHLGLYSFLRLPFGLKNAPASFQSMMDLIFRDQIDKHLAVFIDDINVYSQTFNEHLDHIRQTFEKCRKYGLRLKKKKCHFACEQLEFLGHVVSSKGLMVDDRKIEAIQEYGAPKNVQQVKRFLGMTGYYA